jgi:outer membrane protein
MLVFRTAALALTFVAFGGAALAADVRPADVRPAAPTATFAPANGLYLHIGPAALAYDESATMEMPVGTPFPGAGISVKWDATIAAEIGYFVTPNFAISFTGGFPPTATVVGGGTAAALGTMGHATYGPSTLTAHYHFTQFGSVQPYVGGGLVMSYVFSEKDGAVSRLNVENSFGWAIQAGVDVMINANWGLFVDVKKAFLKTDATGFIGATPIKAEITLDPTVYHAGLTYRF